MEIQLKKGLLDGFVLSLLSKKDYYGYNLLQDVSDVIQVSESTLYPILRRLEEKRFLNTYNKEYNGRVRKYYTITIEGIQKLGEFKRMCDDLKIIINKITGGKEYGIH